MAWAAGLLAWTVSVAVVGPTSEGAPPAADPLAEAAVVRACNEALGAELCEGASQTQLGTFVARVDFEDEFVVVELKGAAGASASRQLPFLPTENREQRWRAAGLLVAALGASFEETKPETPPRGEVATTTGSVEPVPGPLGRWTLDAAALVTPLFGREPGFGGELRTGFQPFARRWFVTASGRAFGASVEGGQTLGWVASLGAGWSLVSVRGGLDGSLWVEGLVETLEVGWSGERQSGTRFGGRLGTRWGWRLARVSPFVGLDVALLGPSLEAQRNGQPWLEVPPWEAGATLGLRFDLLAGAP